MTQPVQLQLDLACHCATDVAWLHAAQEEEKHLAIIQRLPKKEQNAMRAIWDQMIQAKQNCEQIAFRGHRLLDQVSDDMHRQMHSDEQSVLVRGCSAACIVSVWCCSTCSSHPTPALQPCHMRSQSCIAALSSHVVRRWCDALARSCKATCRSSCVRRRSASSSWWSSSSGTRRRRSAHGRSWPGSGRPPRSACSSCCDLPPRASG